MPRPGGARPVQHRRQAQRGLHPDGPALRQAATPTRRSSSPAVAARTATATRPTPAACCSPRVGFSKLPERFTSALDPKGKFSHTPYDFPTLVEVSKKLVRQAVERSGGKVEKDADGEEVFVIPVVDAEAQQVRARVSPRPGGRQQVHRRRDGQDHGEEMRGPPIVKILVTAKRVPDPNQKVSVRADGRGIDDEDLPYVLNPFDEVALEEALLIRERSAGPVEVVVVGIGSEVCEEQLRIALAMGADRAILVPCDEPLDSWNVARILQQLVLRESPQLVLMGKQAIDDDANQAGQFLAALLSWPQATFASRMQFVDGAIQVDRETDAGVETVRVRLPAVVTADLRLNQPRYAALTAILRARKKPLERVTLTMLGLAIEPRVRVLGLDGASSSRNCRLAASVDELVDQLREAKVV